LALRGSLSETSLADVLQLIASSRKTGCLTVIDRHNVGNIYFEDGMLTYAAVVNRPDRIGDILVSQGKITRSQLERAMKVQRVKPERRIGSILVELGYASREDIEDVLKKQIEEAIYHLMKLNRGEFIFEQGRVCDEGEFKVSLNVLGVVLEQARKIDEWNLLKDKVQSPNLVLGIREGIDGRALKVNDKENIILLLVDGRRTVRELAEISGLGEYETYKVVYSLMSAGILEGLDVRSDQGAALPGLMDAREHIGISMAFLNSGMFKEAFEELEKAKEVEPESDEVSFLIGGICQLTGRYEESARVYYALLRKRPRNWKVLNNMGRLFIKLGKLNLALKVLEKGLELHGESSRLYLNLGCVYYRRGEYETSLGYFRKALDMAPDFSAAEFYLALALFRMGDYNGAIERFRGLLGRGYEDDRILNNIGLVYLRKGSVERAILELKKALALNPSLVAARRNLGEIYYWSGSYDSAIEEYRKAIESGGDSPELWCRLGDIYHKWGELERAQQSWQRALELDPKCKPAINGLGKLKGSAVAGA